MKDEKLLDLYSDYLISLFGQTTATGLSALLNHEISHDAVQRFLSDVKRTSTDLWRIVKWQGETPLETHQERDVS